MVPVMNINKFERFFRVAAGLDVDKNDLKRYSDFVNQKVYDLLVSGIAAATQNGRDIAALPPLNLTYSYETEERLPRVVGGLSVALARTFTIVDPDLKNPQAKHWEQAFRIFDLLL